MLKKTDHAAKNEVFFQLFLAAMSSSSSDNVTQYVCSSVRLFVRPFVGSSVRPSVAFFLFLVYKPIRPCHL